MSDALATTTTNSNPSSNITVATSRLSKPWKITDNGVSFIAICESGIMNGTYRGLPVVDGMILKVYVDSKGYPTVSLGHKVLQSDHLDVGDIISVERARQFAKMNITEAESAINRRIRVPLYQHEYDSLVSIAFNAGPGHGIAGLVDYINTGNYSEVPSYIRTYRSNGVEWRRNLEARLFEKGDYNAQH